MDTNPNDSYEPNDAPAQATPIAYGQTTDLAYIYSQAGADDLDFFRFTGAAGDQIRAEMQAAAQIGGQLDSFLFLLGPDGKVLAENDDRGTPRIDSDSEINFTLPAAGFTSTSTPNTSEIAPVRYRIHSRVVALRTL